jgi:hypothetical protein
LHKSKAELDSALNRFEPGRGQDIKSEICALSESLALVSRFGQDKFDYFLNQLGSLENFKERVSRISVGGKSASKVKIALYEAGVTMRDYPREKLHEIMKSQAFMTLSDNPSKTITLIRLSPRELGLGDRACTLAEISERIGHLGLRLCPREIIPEMRVQHVAKTNDSETQYIAMTPFIDFPDEVFKTEQKILVFRDSESQGPQVDFLGLAMINLFSADKTWIFCVDSKNSNNS